MAKWSTPGIVFREIDNSVRNNTEAAIGVGAIVLKANKGFVNQRILNTSRAQFHSNFGDQESDTDYGHFAADQYLSVARDLLAVRATMGDEGYAFIQYPYTDAIGSDVKYSDDMQEMKYTDNEGINQLKLLKKFDQTNTYFSQLYDEGWAYSAIGSNGKVNGKIDGITNEQQASAFALFSKGKQFYIDDLTDEDTEPSYYVARENKGSDPAYSANSGYFYKINTVKPGAELHTSFTPRFDATKVTSATSDISNINTCVSACFRINTNMATWASGYDSNGDLIQASGYQVQVHYPASAMLTNEVTNFSFYVSGTDLNTLNSNTLNGLLNLPIAGLDYPATKALKAASECSRLDLQDWSDLETKTFYVSAVNTAGTKTAKEVHGIQFREYGLADYSERLVVANANNSYYTVKGLNDLSSTEAVSVAASYGIDDVSEILNDNFAVIKFIDATYSDTEYYDGNDADDDDWVLIYKTKDEGFNKYGIKETDALFFTYFDEKTKNMNIVSNYINCGSNGICVPRQIDVEGDGVINKLKAFATSEVLADTTGKYKDGYTPNIDTDDEPGNGDVERYASQQDNQLVIAAYGPGEFGNDIGVSIITPEAATVKALAGNQNAFSWKYQFDDEEAVNNASDDYTDNPENLTWKKVYKINVYQKLKSQNASTWGSGLDALVSDPVESFLVSNDPNVKDANGNSLYAPNVINGISQFIYVSRKSVNGARTFDGKYAMPKMTYSIYQLTGGTNSKLNNIKEKTAALKLYTDRQKANFDILFNVEPIDTFQSRQKFAAHQRRIAEIASDRGLDIGVIQVTSKEAKTSKLALSEAKMFSFANGSYVAAYAGYDKYYDSYTSNWVYLPKSVAAACSMAYCDMYANTWNAPAMTPRGQISYSSGQLLKLSDLEIGQLYDNNINVSRTCAGYGELLWCQKTMLKKDSALNRINVRRLVNYIEKQLEVMLLPFLYANNTANTRANMKNTVDSFLSRIMAGEGILSKDVSITTDEQDPHIVYVNISIVPAETIEWICVTTTVNRNSGITSSES